MITNIEQDKLFKTILSLDDCYTSETKLLVRFLKERGLGITYGGLRAYLEHLLENHKGKRYKAATVAWKLAAAKHRIRYIFEHSPGSLDITRQYRLEKALKEIKSPKVNSQAVGKDKVLTNEEVHALIIECKDKTIALMVEFLFCTGVRISEALGILLSDCRRLNDHYEIRVLGKGKKERIVFASFDLISRIEEHSQGTTYLFEHGGRQYNRISVTNRIKAQGEKILQKEISAHTLRHSFATEKLEKSGNLKAVSKYLGHSSTATTADLYWHSEFTWQDLRELA